MCHEGGMCRRDGRRREDVMTWERIARYVKTKRAAWKGSRSTEINDYFNQHQHSLTYLSAARQAQP